jgi:WD40 repeat protein
MSSVVLATAGYDHTIRFWEATSGICYRTLQYADSQVNKLEITSEKQYIAAAGNSQVRLFEVNSSDPQPVSSYEGHQGNVTAVGFQKDSKWMYTGETQLNALRACSSSSRSSSSSSRINNMLLVARHRQDQRATACWVLLQHQQQ